MLNYLNQIKGLENSPNFDNHRLISFLFDEEVGLSGFIAIHRGGNKYPSFGATRIWSYATQIDALKDALVLSKTMSYKIALAGLKYGGAKAVILENSIKPEKRKALLLSYAQKLKYLDGHFITGADVGITDNDVKMMKKVCPHLVGVKVDPVQYTIKGIISGISICLEEVFHESSLGKRTFAIQGLGKIGFGLLKVIAPHALKVYIADINNQKVKEAVQKYKNVKAVSVEEISTQKVDVFSPCALSGSININNINLLKCQIIAGGGNCQLENSQIGELLHKLGILYAPDYIINAGGIISVVDEYENHSYNEKRILQRMQKIPQTLKQVINQSKKDNLPTNILADRKAKEISDTRN